MYKIKYSSESFDTEAFTSTMRFDLETGVLIHSEVVFEATFGEDIINAHLVVEKLPDFVMDFASMDHVIFHDSIVTGTEFNWKFTNLEYSPNFPQEWKDDFGFTTGDIITIKLTDNPPTDIETALDWDYGYIFEILRNGVLMSEEDMEHLQVIFPMIPIVPTTIVWDDSEETSLFELFYEYWQYREVFNNDYQWFDSTLTTEYLELVEYHYYEHEDGSSEAFTHTFRFDLETGVMIYSNVEYDGYYDGEWMSVSMTVELTDEEYTPPDDDDDSNGDDDGDDDLAIDLSFNWLFTVLAISFIGVASISLRRK